MSDLQAVVEFIATKDTIELDDELEQLQSLPLEDEMQGGIADESEDEDIPAVEQVNQQGSRERTQTKAQAFQAAQSTKPKRKRARKSNGGHFKT